MLSVNDMTRIMGRVIGRRVRHAKVPIWMFLKAARMSGLDPLLLSQLPFTSGTRMRALSPLAVRRTMRSRGQRVRNTGFLFSTKERVAS